MRLCIGCGAPLSRPRQRFYCSERCKMRWRRFCYRFEARGGARPLTREVHIQVNRRPTWQERLWALEAAL